MPQDTRENSAESENRKSAFLNWGTGLAIAILLFVVTTLGMVAYISSLDYHMVTENHYEKAVHYQQHIDRMMQTRNLDSQIEIESRSHTGNIRIGFPEALLTPRPSGTVTLYRPSDSRLDRTYELKLDDQGIQYIPAANLKSGKWLIRVTWQNGNKEYYKENVVFL